MITLLASTNWAPFFQTAIGALVGAGGAIGGGAFGSWFSWQKERQAIAAALAAEIEAVKTVAEFREYRRLIQDCIDVTKANKKAKWYAISVADHPFPVFENNVNKIGFLPAELARQVTTFYSYASGVVNDFRSLSTANLYNWPVSEVVIFLENVAAGIDASMNIARDLVPKLQKESARSWSDYLRPLSQHSGSAPPDVPG